MKQMVVAFRRPMVALFDAGTVTLCGIPADLAGRVKPADFASFSVAGVRHSVTAEAGAEGAKADTLIFHAEPGRSVQWLHIAGVLNKSRNMADAFVAFDALKSGRVKEVA